MSDLRQQKKNLRRDMEQRRAEAFAKNPDAFAAVRDGFLKNVKLPPVGIVSAYLARGTEMNPAPLVEALRLRGYQIALPVVGQKNMPGSR